MDYVKLGRTGMDVSRLCLGCMTFGVPDRGTHPWTLDEEQSRPIIRRAVELGINFFDTANSYSDGTSEEITGRLLREHDAPRRDRRRHQGVLPDRQAGPERPRACRARPSSRRIDASLRRLGMDYVDLYQIHRWDDRTPIEETLEALHDVVKAGKARYIGASSMFAWQFATALQVAIAPRLDALRHDAEPRQPALPRGGARDAAAVPRRRASACMPWSPLARGRLTRDWRETSTREETDEVGKKLYTAAVDADRAVIDAVAAVAAARGVPRAQVALAWVVQQPGITAPIIGASRVGHLEDAVAALALRLTPEELAALEAPYVPHPVSGI